MRATAVLRTTAGPKIIASPAASSVSPTAMAIWPALRSRAAVSGLRRECISPSLPKPVDPVVMIRSDINRHIADEGFLTECLTHVVGIGIITASRYDPSDIIPGWVPQSRQPLTVAALIY